MDAMDVLGALLGRKSKSGRAGGNILTDILGGGRGRAPKQPQPRQHPRAQRPRTIGDAARDLEDLLNVSHQHHEQRRTPSPPQPVPQSVPQSVPRQPAPKTPAPQQEALNQQAQVLVRAMVNASKSDGQITQDEQEKIVQQLGNASQETIGFLRDEFRRPVDVKEFAFSVPRGLEEQVYTMSLIAMDLDEQKEAEYLADLAHGLRLDVGRCNEIHQNFGAPVIFQT